MSRDELQKLHNETAQDLAGRYPHTVTSPIFDIDGQIAILRRERSRIARVNPTSPLLAEIDADIARLTALTNES